MNIGVPQDSKPGAVGEGEGAMTGRSRRAVEFAYQVYEAGAHPRTHLDPGGPRAPRHRNVRVDGGEAEFAGARQMMRRSWLVQIRRALMKCARCHLRNRARVHPPFFTLSDTQCQTRPTGARDRSTERAFAPKSRRSLFRRPLDRLTFTISLALLDPIERTSQTGRRNGVEFRNRMEVDLPTSDQQVRVVT